MHDRASAPTGDFEPIQSTAPTLFLPYPPIEAHGVIGDRRTAALIAADGTLDWLCIPTYGGPPVFGALLDADRGGYWRLGPAQLVVGRQDYRDGGLVLTTTWDINRGTLELTDAMAWPGRQAVGAQDRHVIVRRLACAGGPMPCRVDLVARHDFGASAAIPIADGALLRIGNTTPRLWASCPILVTAEGVHAEISVQAGEPVWMVLDTDPDAKSWTTARAEQLLTEAHAETHEWATHVRGSDEPANRVRRSAQLFHLLSYAPTGSLVAAPTTSLPERIGGDRNYDYRFAWVRDASLSAAMLALVDDLECAEGYLDWLAELGSSTDSPLQVVYAVDGGQELEERERHELAGYRGSRPVRYGNRAAGQRQLDSLGWLVDCAWIYLDRGGSWREPYWDLVRRAANYTAASWEQPDSGIWELPEHAHYVSSKVMSWVALDRAIRIAERVGRADEIDGWRHEMQRVHAEVMARGWSERLGTFLERYDRQTIDASGLLIPVMGFLPAEHPRVTGTINRIEATLAPDGLVRRFEASDLPAAEAEPAGEVEGAFLPTTFWLATTYALRGDRAAAETILGRVEAAAGTLGLFAEELDPRTGAFLGNYPLLFAQMEYVRAVLCATQQADPVS